MPVTGTVMVHDELPPSTAPVTRMELEPGKAETEPPQSIVGAGELAIVKPEGKLSGKPIFVMGTVPVFNILRVRIETAPDAIVLGVKYLLTLTPAVLLSVASDFSRFFAPLNVVTPLIGISLVRLPFTVVVMLRLKVQDAPAARLPPLNEKLPAPGLPVSVPPQVPKLKAGGLEMIMPNGMLSENTIPLKGAPLLFLSSTLSVEADPPDTFKGEKLLLTVIVRSCTVIAAVAGKAA